MVESRKNAGIVYLCLLAGGKQAVKNVIEK